MGDPYLIHDAAWATSAAVLELFNLREEERAEAFPLVYDRVRDGILTYVALKQRERRRLFGPPPRDGEGHR